jgi:hypothetical protein
MKITKKRCASCTHWFKPNPKTKDRQHYCSKAACQKASKRAAQAQWIAKNPNYYKGHGRKAKIRSWAKDYPHYWKQWRLKHPEYAQRERERQRAKRALRVAKQDEIRQNPLGYLKDTRILISKTVAKQDEIRLSIERMLDFLMLRVVSQNKKSLRPPRLLLHNASHER